MADEKITCYMPVAFFGGREAERGDDIWIKGERYRTIVATDGPVDWTSDYKTIDLLPDDPA